MKKSQSLKLSKAGRLPDGSLRFIVRLPKDLADLFEAEMKIHDRKKLPMARFIISTYFRERSFRKEDATLHQTGRSGGRQVGYHFGGNEPRLLQDGVVQRFPR